MKFSDILTEIVPNAFRGCGYVYANGENSARETELESEVSSEEEYADLPSTSEEITDDEL